MPDPVAADRAPAGQPPMPSPPLVAVAGWLLPGAGYWLIGHRARAIVVGVTIITLFTSGILIGGVRAIQVPGYGENGGALYVLREQRDRAVRTRITEQRPGDRRPPGNWVVTDFPALLGEVGNKPWSICQVLTGPVALAGGAWSVWASRPAGEVPPPADTGDSSVISVGGGEPRGVLSHSRINEIAVLYTAVAGMLNLLVIIDAAARAGGAHTTHSASAKSSQTSASSSASFAPAPAAATSSREAV